MFSSLEEEEEDVVDSSITAEDRFKRSIGTSITTNHDTNHLNEVLNANMRNINDGSSSSSTDDNESTISIDFASRCDITRCDSLECQDCTNKIIDAVKEYEDSICQDCTECFIDAVIAYEDSI